MDKIVNPSIESISSLIQKFSLQKYTPDWEYLVADATKVDDFLSFYKDNNLTDNEKFTLMIIIIGSFDDSLKRDQFCDNLWVVAESILQSDYQIHEYTINYWCYDEVDIEDAFCITPFIRKIRDRVEGKFLNLA